MESLRYPIICHPSIQPSIYSYMSSSTSKSKQQMSCPHSNFSVPLLTAHTRTHTASISPTDIVSQWPAHLSHKPPLFLHRSSLLSLHRQLSGASGCYHAPGNQRYSHMSQIGVNSYYSGEGVEGKWKLTYQKGHSSDNPPPPLSLSLSPFARPVLDVSFFFPFTDQWYLTNNTNVIPLPSALSHYPSWFNGPVNYKYSLFNVF